MSSVSSSTAQGHWGGPLVAGQPTVCCPSMATPTSSWFVDHVSGSAVLCGDLSREAGPASAIATISCSATTRHVCTILAFVEFKVASFQLESEIPFQPLEWPGNLQPRGPWQYNDAWHNSTTVSPTGSQETAQRVPLCGVLCCPTTSPSFTQTNQEACLCGGAHNNAVGRFRRLWAEYQGYFTSHGI